jgi:hypothetical protein
MVLNIRTIAVLPAPSLPSRIIKIRQLRIKGQVHEGIKQEIIIVIGVDGANAKIAPNQSVILHFLPLAIKCSPPFVCERSII